MPTTVTTVRMPVSCADHRDLTQPTLQTNSSGSLLEPVPPPPGSPPLVTIAVHSALPSPYLGESLLRRCGPAWKSLALLHQLSGCHPLCGPSSMKAPISCSAKTENSGKGITPNFPLWWDSCYNTPNPAFLDLGPGGSGALCKLGIFLPPTHLRSPRRGQAGEAYSSYLRLPGAAEEPGSWPWPAPRGPRLRWCLAGQGDWRGQSRDSGPSLQLEPASLIYAAPTTEPPLCRCKEPWGPVATSS